MAEKIEKKPVAKNAPAKKAETKAAPVKEKKSPKAKVAEEKKVEVKEEKKSTKKVSAKKVEEVKPTVTEAKASALSVKITPRKARYVLDAIRGKDVDEALGILANSGRAKANRIVSKLILSAKANATNNYNMNEEKLYIASIQASDSIKMRRYLPRAKGSASGMVKRYSNIYVTLKERD